MESHQKRHVIIWCVLVGCIIFTAVIASYKLYRFIHYDGIDGVIMFAVEDYKEYEILPVTILEKSCKNGFISKMHYFDGMEQMGFKLFFTKSEDDEKFISQISFIIVDEEGTVLLDSPAYFTDPDSFMNYTYMNIHAHVALEKGEKYTMSIFRNKDEAQDIETAEKYIVVEFSV